MRNHQRIFFPKIQHPQNKTKHKNEKTETSLAPHHMMSSVSWYEVTSRSYFSQTGEHHFMLALTHLLGLLQLLHFACRSIWGATRALTCPLMCLSCWGCCCPPSSPAPALGFISAEGGFKLFSLYLYLCHERAYLFDQSLTDKNLSVLSLGKLMRSSSGASSDWNNVSVKSCMLICVLIDAALKLPCCLWHQMLDVWWCWLECRRTNVTKWSLLSPVLIFANH